MIYHETFFFLISLAFTGGTKNLDVSEKYRIFHNKYGNIESRNGRSSSAVNVDVNVNVTIGCAQSWSGNYSKSGKSKSTKSARCSSGKSKSSKSKSGKIQTYAPTYSPSTSGASISNYPTFFPTNEVSKEPIELPTTRPTPLKSSYTPTSEISSQPTKRECVPLDPNPYTFEKPNNVFPKAPWTTGGDGKWAIDSTSSHTGKYSIKSPNFNDSPVLQTSNATLTVCDDFAGGPLTFRVLSSVLPPQDSFVVYVDGIGAARLTDVQKFTEVNLELSPGSHRVDFSYQYNLFNLDPVPPVPPTILGAVWIDSVALGFEAPVIPPSTEPIISPTSKAPTSTTPTASPGSALPTVPVTTTSPTPLTSPDKPTSITIAPTSPITTTSPTILETSASPVIPSTAQPTQLPTVSATVTEAPTASDVTDFPSNAPSSSTYPPTVREDVPTYSPTIEPSSAAPVASTKTEKPSKGPKPSKKTDSPTESVSSATTESPVGGPNWSSCLDPNPYTFEKPDDEFPKKPWTTGGDGDWQIDKKNAQEGKNSIKSPDLESLGSSKSFSNATLAIDCKDFPGGVLIFNVLAPVIPPYDIFVWYVDGVEIGRTANAVEWIEIPVPMAPGSHTVDFQYQYNPFDTPDLLSIPVPPGRQGAVWIDVVGLKAGV